METGLAELAEAACHVTMRNATPRAHINARDNFTKVKQIMRGTGNGWGRLYRLDGFRVGIL